MVLLAFLVEDPAAEPVGVGSLGHAVVGGPGDAALSQLRMLEQPAHLLVAQDGDAVRRRRIPAALTGLVDLVRRDRKRRVCDVERGDRTDGERRHVHYLQEHSTGWSLNTLEIGLICQEADQTSAASSCDQATASTQPVPNGISTTSRKADASADGPGFGSSASRAPTIHRG